MSKTTKIVLSIVAALVVLAVGVGFVAVRLIGGFTLDAEKSTEIGQEIVAHELPDQFEPFFGLNLFGLQAMMAATNLDAAGDVGQDGAVLFLISLPDGASEDEVRTEASGQFNDQVSGNVTLEFEGSRTDRMNGEEIQVEMYVGTADDGTQVRQELGIFRAENGNLAMVMMMAPQEGFAEAGFDEFLASTN